MHGPDTCSCYALTPTDNGQLHLWRNAINIFLLVTGNDICYLMCALDFFVSHWLRFIKDHRAILLCEEPLQCTKMMSQKLPRSCHVSWHFISSLQLIGEQVTNSTFTHSIILYLIGISITSLISLPFGSDKKQWLINIALIVLIIVPMIGCYWLCP